MLSQGVTKGLQVRLHHGTKWLHHGILFSWWDIHKSLPLPAKNNKNNKLKKTFEL